MHKAATRDKYSSARVVRDLDQYIVDPTTKKRYLRGRFLGKVHYTIGTNGHLKNPEINTSKRTFDRKFILDLSIEICRKCSCFTRFYREGLQNATSSQIWRPRKSWLARSSRRPCWRSHIKKKRWAGETPKNSIGRVVELASLDVLIFIWSLNCIYVDVYGDCHPSFSGFQIRNTQAHRWVSWVLRGRRLYVHPVGVVQTEGKLSWILRRLPILYWLLVPITFS